MGVDDGDEEVAEGTLVCGRGGGGRVVDDGGEDAHDVEGTDRPAVEEGCERIAADAIGVLEVVGLEYGVRGMHAQASCTATRRSRVGKGSFFFILKFF